MLAEKTKPVRPWNARYPWEEWFRSRRFTLRRGRDYDCSQSSMSQQVRNAAARRRLRVSLVERGDRIVVAVSGRPAEGRGGGV